MTTTFSVQIDGGEVRAFEAMTGVYSLACIAAVAMLTDKNVADVKIWIPELLPDYGPYYYRVQPRTTGSGFESVHLVERGTMSDIENLIERVKKLRVPSNWIDVEIELAVFQPDDLYASVRPNSKATKVIYTMKDGSEKTCLANDWTLNEQSKAKAINLLKAASFDPATTGVGMDHTGAMWLEHPSNMPELQNLSALKLSHERN